MMHFLITTKYSFYCAQHTQCKKTYLIGLGCKDKYKLTIHVQQVDNPCTLPPKGKLSLEWTIENLGRFLWSQFWSDVYKILSQGVNMYPLSGNLISFSDRMPGSKVMSYTLGQFLQKSSFTSEIWHVCNLHDKIFKCQKK